MKIKSEWDLISKIQNLVREKGTGVPEELGRSMGEDCAVYKIAEARYGLFTTDISIENIHFRQDYSSPEEIGYKSMTGNLSDIISMGGSPVLALVSLGIPDDKEEEFVLDIYRGMLDACREPGTVIAGGDTSGSDTLIVSIAVYGECREREPVYRNGASAGDYIYVTGTPGESLAGLEILQRGSGRQMEKYGPLVEKHRRPSCRYDIMNDILDLYSPTAMIDISDGLLSDLGHICTESRRGFTLQKEKLPVSALLKEYCSEKERNPYEMVLTGGEDYQLLFTSALPPEKIPGGRTGDAVCMGEITDDGYCLEISGRKKEISITGFDHFTTGKEK